MNKTIIAILACHCNSHIKFHTAINNINKIYKNIKFFSIIDSKEAVFSNNLKNFFNKDKKLAIHEIISNNNLLDYGKWVYILKKFVLKYNINFDYILLLNDSILLTDDIDDYFNSLIKTNANLYAYNDSTQLGIYHYQSYLFSIHRDVKLNFVNFIDSKKNIRTYDELIQNVELKICSIVRNHDCFIKIGNKKNNYGKNLIWHNEQLYKSLLTSYKYKIIKIKKILEYYEKFNYSFDKFINFNENYYRNRYGDLKNIDNLKIHFKDFGFKEGRRCSKEIVSFLPNYYRSVLKKINILNIFDVPDDFDIYFYKRNNDYIKDLDNKECMIHYLEYGVHNNLKYL